MTIEHAIQRDVMEYDVVIVGAGPAGLATAIRLKHLAKKNQQELSVCILDKGSEVGSHIISGCVMNPLGLNELIPEWQQLNFPVATQVTSDTTLFLTPKRQLKLPVPKDWQNHDNYIISLSQLCRRLAEYAEQLGVEIYPGFAAAAPIIENDTLKGVITGDMGLERDGTIGDNFQAGMEIRAKQTVLAEGCRGSLTKQITEIFNLTKNSQPQTYGLGIKEIWRINPSKHKQGSITHTLGFPLDNQTYGGGFIYHMADNLLSIGLVTALDYKNPYLSPYEEFQKFKQHPLVADLLHGGERLEYGARTVSEGGLQALPKLSFNGGILVGDCAGFLNIPKIKGVHNSIKSGILGAESIYTTIIQNKLHADNYQKSFELSWLYKDLYAVRNIRPAFQYGRLFGIIYAGFEKYILRNKVPWTLRIKHADHQATTLANESERMNYVAYDNKLTFDKASSVHLANVVHEDSQPIHLKLKNHRLAIEINHKHYASPETRFCPAGVYEIIKKANQPILQINAQNCVHCKACDIKDPTQNINWTTPEGSSGPQYSDM
jgi:electron-transferring-flavoprotein dehydrogenase